MYFDGHAAAYSCCFPRPIFSSAHQQRGGMSGEGWPTPLPVGCHIYLSLRGWITSICSFFFIGQPTFLLFFHIRRRSHGNVEKNGILPNSVPHRTLRSTSTTPASREAAGRASWPQGGAKSGHVATGCRASHSSCGMLTRETA